MRLPLARLPHRFLAATRDFVPAVPQETAVSRGEFSETMHWVQGPRRPVQLTDHQWQLLGLLFEYRGAYLTRETILSRVWGPYYVSQAHLLDETVAALRKAMRHAGFPGDMIRHERDLGIGIGIAGGTLEGERIR
jgi:DNA-binding response OmpR family regulator